MGRRMKFRFDSDKAVSWGMVLGVVVLLVLAIVILVKVNKEDYHDVTGPKRYTSCISDCGDFRASGNVNDLKGGCWDCLSESGLAMETCIDGANLPWSTPTTKKQFCDARQKVLGACPGNTYAYSSWKTVGENICQ